MRTHLATLLPRLRAAVDRRSDWAEDRRHPLQQALRVIESDYAGVDGSEAGDAAGADPFLGLGTALGLDDLDLELLLVAAAPDLDATFGLAFGLLRGTPGPAPASLGLALELCGLGSLDPRGPEHLGAGSVLVRRGVLQASGGPWLGRELGLPERVLGHLLGADVIDPEVAALAVHPVPLAVDGITLAARAITVGAPLIWIRSPIDGSGPSLAAGAFAAAGMRSICIDLDRSGQAPLEDLLRRVVREAALLEAGLILLGAERIVRPAADQALPPPAAPGPALTALHEAPVPVVVVARTSWDAHWPGPFPLCLDAAALSPQDRTLVWSASGGGEAAAAGLAGLRLGSEAIAQTAAYAQGLAAATGQEVDADLVRQAARRVSGSGAQQAAGRTRFADLVLPTPVDTSLRRLVSWARHRDEALSRGSLLDLGDKGAGLAALFTGSPGTGKTLAAHVVADELGLELVQVDLSAVVDKYIGETEKNLERIFARAESLNVVLFFDEADALFGRRTEVKDSHDRHANQEVAYLLQRMEHFNGLTILATNLRGNLDAAFSRRLHFVVHFPDPDTATRRRLWASHLERLGPLDPADLPDVDELAGSIELAGGDIRNIVLAAGYDAAAAGELPGMAHVRAAARSEYHKLGRRPPAALDRVPDGVLAG